MVEFCILRYFSNPQNAKLTDRARKKWNSTSVHISPFQCAQIQHCHHKKRTQVSVLWSLCPWSHCPIRLEILEGGVEVQILVSPFKTSTAAAAAAVAAAGPARCVLQSALQRLQHKLSPFWQSSSTSIWALQDLDSSRTDKLPELSPCPGHAHELCLYSFLCACSSFAIPATNKQTTKLASKHID